MKQRIPPPESSIKSHRSRQYLELVEGGGAASGTSRSDDRSRSGDAGGGQGRRPWACLLPHIGPRLRQVILLGADRGRDHISGYRITRPRKVETVPYPLPQPPESEVEAAKMAPISSPSSTLARDVSDVDVGFEAAFVAGVTGKKRGQVVRYSDEARKRLTTAVLSVGHELLPRKRGQRRGKLQFFVPASFVTLTYHVPNIPHIDTCYL